MGRTAPDPDRSSEIDELLDTLSHGLRREVVRYFEQESEKPTATLDELVAHVEDHRSAWSHERVELLLAQVHLPKLESRGWLDYEHGDREVRYHGHPEATALLEEVREVFA